MAAHATRERLETSERAYFRSLTSVIVKVADPKKVASVLSVNGAGIDKIVELMPRFSALRDVAPEEIRSRADEIIRDRQELYSHLTAQLVSFAPTDQRENHHYRNNVNAVAHIVSLFYVPNRDLDLVMARLRGDLPALAEDMKSHVRLEIAHGRGVETNRPSSISRVLTLLDRMSSNGTAAVAPALLLHSLHRGDLTVVEGLLARERRS